MDGHLAAATLGVPGNATKEEIRRAFRTGVKRVHPDAVGIGDSGELGGQPSSEAFLLLRQAYEVLIKAASSSPAASAPVDRCRWVRSVPGPSSSLHNVDVVDSTVSRGSLLADLARPASAFARHRNRNGREQSESARHFGDCLAAALAEF